jgi:hypothetical protein
MRASGTGPEEVEEICRVVVLSTRRGRSSPPGESSDSAATRIAGFDPLQSGDGRTQAPSGWGTTAGRARQERARPVHSWFEWASPDSSPAKSRRTGAAWARASQFGWSCVTPPPFGAALAPGASAFAAFGGTRRCDGARSGVGWTGSRGGAPDATAAVARVPPSTSARGTTSAEGATAAAAGRAAAGFAALGAEDVTVAAGIAPASLTGLACSVTPSEPIRRVPMMTPAIPKARAKMIPSLAPAGSLRHRFGRGAFESGADEPSAPIIESPLGS